MIRIAPIAAALLILLVSGCSSQALLSDNALIAQTHLEGMGFKVLSMDREGTYTFTDEDLVSKQRAQPHEEIWAVQEHIAESFSGQMIITITFTVQEHPLDNAFGMGKTKATVMIIEGEVIGGWAYPVSKDNDVSGAPYSLDGKAPE
ncbi:hypothetical protein [Alteribacter keqinensis]|uniref:DUF4830 domain-containing protein n=1 Tax=Alteribacter keqinensis TaxID=2483800 RepID=A0A3M7TNU1_9BACI|nr:hypothetical protein [Alteribacter keqinensis]RNA67122.1 hypothetical protein EBO34_18210 [Alteribacter keqinensis]